MLLSLQHPTDFGCIYEAIYVTVTMRFVLDAGTLKLTKAGVFDTLRVLKAVKRLLSAIFNILLAESEQTDKI